jgi:hypothetical protein
VENSGKQNTERLTAVWQNGGFSAKFNGSSSIELLCKTEHLCFYFRHFAKLQTVMGKFIKLQPNGKRQTREPPTFYFDTS